MTTSIEYRQQQNALDTLEVIKSFFDKNLPLQLPSYLPYQKSWALDFHA